MSGDCLDIGTIQAFLDGEVPPERSIVLADHIAGCDACSLMLADAEEENSFVFAALDRELDTLVPTQRLWGKINDELELDAVRKPFWQRLCSAISAQIMSPSLTAAGGILLFVVIAGGVWMFRPMTTADIVVNNPPVSAPAPSPNTTTAPAAGNQTVAVGNVPDTVEPATSSGRPVLMNASHRETAVPKLRPRVEDPIVTTAQYFEGEEGYVRTINTLNVSVDAQKDRVLPPALRVAFERDLAVVDDTIKRTREYVRKNPRDQAAKQVLYSSYQDKIDLLNSVGQRDELMASLR